MAAGTCVGDGVRVGSQQHAMRGDLRSGQPALVQQAVAMVW